MFCLLVDGAVAHCGNASFIEGLNLSRGCKGQGPMAVAELPPKAATEKCKSNSNVLTKELDRGG